MKKILILFAHPRLERSEVNSIIVHSIKDLPFVTLIDLYKEYPTFDIDVEKEQQRLREHDILVFQHPVYWYSSPAILKEWQDLVLEYGFAYGSDASELKGKLFFNAVTCGGSKDVYKPDGLNRNELRDLFTPFEQTVRLCKMKYLPPFALFSAGHAIENNTLTPHIERYKGLLEALSQNNLDIAKASKDLTLCECLTPLLKEKGKE